MNIGIIGAGFIGRAVARLAIRSGHQVLLSNSRHPRTLASTMIALNCKIGTPKDAAAFGDVVMLAVPFFSLSEIAPDPLVGKIVMDATNYYPMRDGANEALDRHETTVGEIVAKHLSGAKLVRTFSAILEKDIEKDASPKGSANRRALPIAGEDDAAKSTVSNLLDSLGFDVVDAGKLSEGWRFERARPAYCVPLAVDGLKAALADAGTTVAEGSWRR